jgi:hypothetical protein
MNQRITLNTDPGTSDTLRETKVETHSHATNPNESRNRESDPVCTTVHAPPLARRSLPVRHALRAYLSLATCQLWPLAYSTLSFDLVVRVSRPTPLPSPERSAVVGGLTSRLPCCRVLCAAPAPIHNLPLQTKTTRRWAPRQRSSMLLAAVRPAQITPPVKQPVSLSRRHAVALHAD